MLLSVVDGWPSARIRYRAQPGTWSAVQIFDHVVKTEERILNLAKLGKASPHRIGITDRIGAAFIQRVFRTDRRVKVPASAAQVLPDDDPDFDTVCTRWQATRLEFHAFLRDLSKEQASSGLFRHPVAGWMGTPQIVNFFCVHMTHHGFQLRRLAAEVALVQ